MDFSSSESPAIMRMSNEAGTAGHPADGAREGSMALDYFWQNLRTAASLFGPPAVSAYSAGVDTEDCGLRFQSAAHWLNPRSVDGFDPKDFEFLEPEQQEALRQSVEAFRAVAATVPRKE